MRSHILLVARRKKRYTGDTENFLGLEIPKKSRGSEVRNSHELVDSLLNLGVLHNATPVATPGRSATAKELASAIPLQGYDSSTVRAAVREIHRHGTLKT